MESKWRKPDPNQPVVKRMPFGQMPDWYVKKGAWKRLSWNEMAVLGVLIIRQDNKTHICWPSLQTLSNDSGVAVSSISKATSGLHQMGLIKKWPRKNRMVYAILFEPSPWIKDTGIFWDTKSDKAPKSSDSYTRDSSTGKFVPRSSEVTPSGDTEHASPRFSEPPIEESGPTGDGRCSLTEAPDSPDDDEVPF